MLDPQLAPARPSATEQTPAAPKRATAGHETLRELRGLHRELRRFIPDTYLGFSELSDGALRDGALDRKTKELIAFAIGVVEGCDGCIASHGQAAARAGASLSEAAEAISVAILMHGGPATIHGARAFEVFCEFAEAATAGEAPA